MTPALLSLFICLCDFSITSTPFVHRNLSASSCYEDRIIDGKHRELRERHGEAGGEKQMDKKGEERGGYGQKRGRGLGKGRKGSD